MENQYKGSWVLPATDHPGMVDNFQKALAEREAERESGTPLVYGTGTETEAIGMLFGMRSVLAKALGVEAGVHDDGGRLGMQVLGVQYDFARSALGGDGVQSAEIDFAVTKATVVDGEDSGSRELHLTTVSSIHRVMHDGSRHFHVSTEETRVLPLDAFTSTES